MAGKSTYKKSETFKKLKASEKRIAEILTRSTQMNLNEAIDLINLLRGEGKK